jgi:hypothetical protein
MCNQWVSAAACIYVRDLLSANIIPLKFVKINHRSESISPHHTRVLDLALWKLISLESITSSSNMLFVNDKNRLVWGERRNFMRKKNYKRGQMCALLPEHHMIALRPVFETMDFFNIPRWLCGEDIDVFIFPPLNPIIILSPLPPSQWLPYVGVPQSRCATRDGDGNDDDVGLFIDFDRFMRVWLMAFLFFTHTVKIGVG